MSSDKLALNSGNDQNVNGPSHPSDAGSTKLNDGGSSGGDALGGKGGSESNNTSSAEAGGNSGIGGSDVGVLFAPGNETGDPDSTDVSLILTDGSGSGGPSEGGIGLSAVTPQDPAPVPEPANLFLLGSGLILAGLTFRRRRLGAATSFRSISS